MLFLTIFDHFRPISTHVRPPYPSICHVWACLRRTLVNSAQILRDRVDSWCGIVFYSPRERFSTDLWPYGPVVIENGPKHCILADFRPSGGSEQPYPAPCSEGAWAALRPFRPPRGQKINFRPSETIFGDIWKNRVFDHF